MIIPIPDVFTADQVRQIRQYLDDAPWQDGSITAGGQAISVKHNQQLDEQAQLTRQLSDAVLDALARTPLFISAALPMKIYPPMFNRYGVGETYGLHVDNAIRVVPGTPTRIRTDLSATLFLSDPDEYEGGELRIEDKFGSHSVKLNAGDLILYPSTSLHKVEPVTKGARVASFFWLQSMIRQHEQRDVLFDLDQSIQSLTEQHGNDHADVMRLSGIYQNLIQQWADT
jgi:PKHD-type hydroxylase